MYSKAITKAVCDQLRAEFQIVVAEANASYKEQHDGKDKPPVFTVQIHECQIIASTLARQIHIIADANAVAWIHAGLFQALKKYIEAELGAIRHTASESLGDGMTPGFLKRLTYCVREKIQWIPAKSSWNLALKGSESKAQHAAKIQEYCRENSLKLSIPQNVSGLGFFEARDAALLDACRVYNAFNKDIKKRIILPEIVIRVEM